MFRIKPTAFGWAVNDPKGNTLSFESCSVMKCQSAALHQLLCWGLAGVCACAIGATRSVQDDPTIVLRDLSVINGVTVTDFDQTGLQLSDGKRIQWDKVLTADVAEEREPEFKNLLSTIGEPMFRLETRLRSQDWSGAGELANSLYDPIRVQDGPNKQLDFLICLAVMRGRLFDGDRAGAVEPFLRAAVTQSKLDESSQTALAGLLLSADEVGSLMSGEIVPHWLDPSTVPAVSQSLSNLVDSGRIPDVLGTAVYLASFAVAQNNLREADRIFAALRDQRNLPLEVEKWLRVVEIERYFVAGETGRANHLSEQHFERLADGARATVLYLQGVYAKDDPQKQLLSLLTVPALFGDRFPNLSASALFKATSLLKEKGDAKEAGILRNELLRRYPNTYHGRLAKKELD